MKEKMNKIVTSIKEISISSKVIIFVGLLIIASLIITQKRNNELMELYAEHVVQIEEYKALYNEVIDENVDLRELNEEYEIKIANLEAKFIELNQKIEEIEASRNWLKNLYDKYSKIYN